jgi:hypothetical protein
MQAQAPGQRGVPAAGDGVAPGIRPQRNEANRKHLPWHRTANSDRPGQAMAPAPAASHRRHLFAGERLRLQVAGRVQ